MTLLFKSTEIYIAERITLSLWVEGASWYFFLFSQKLQNKTVTQTLIGLI